MEQEYLDHLLYPLVAPLSVPMAEHLLSRYCRQQRVSVHQGREWLLKRVAEKRSLVFRYMSAFVLNSQRRELITSKKTILTTKWLLEALRIHDPLKRPVTLQTLFDWKKRGLIHNDARGEPNSDSAAALLLARTIDVGERQWLPEEIAPDEPMWWCWQQTSPEQIPSPCPVPLPSALANATILWTPWAGGNWQHWKLIGRDIGSIRFAGTTKHRVHPMWDVTFQELQCWIPELAHRPTPLRPLLEERTPFQENLEVFRHQALQTLAEETLEQLAYTRPYLSFSLAHSMSQPEHLHREDQ